MKNGVLMPVYDSICMHTKKAIDFMLRSHIHAKASPI